MLTRADEYLVHQTPEPIASVASGDRNFYDRYFFNGFALEGKTFFAAALGQYPNRQLMDAAFSVIHGERQYVVRASRRAGPDRMDACVGPVSVEVIEPMRRLRLVVEPNDWGISADLTFTARVSPIEEPRFFRRSGSLLFMDYTRLTQHVTVEGTLNVAGETLQITPDRFRGLRDRSWGVRPIGERDVTAPSSPVQFYWLWAPAHFDDLCTHFDVNEDAGGVRWHEAGMLIPVGGEIENARSVDYRIEYRSGTRHAKHAEITFHRTSGEDLAVTLEPRYDFSMIGLGYMHPQWGHGMYVGEDEVSGESWPLTDANPAVPLYLHIQSVCDAFCGDRRGVGVLEQLILGPHTPSGFKDLFDLAP